MFFSSETSVTEKRTHLPEGEICGSETRFIAMRSAKVMGRFCWPADVSGATRVAARRQVRRRIGGQCSAVDCRNSQVPGGGGCARMLHVSLTALERHGGEPWRIPAIHRATL